jgi:hypothetical protein
MICWHASATGFPSITIHCVRVACVIREFNILYRTILYDIPTLQHLGDLSVEKKNLCQYKSSPALAAAAMYQ